MSGVRKLYESLSEPSRDLFVAVASDLQGSASPHRIEKLEEYQKKLKQEIDRVNWRRESLGGALNNVTSLLQRVDAFIAEHGDDLELLCFRNHLERLAMDIREEINAMKPEEKLAKKYDVGRKITLLKERQQLAAKLLSEVVNGPKEASDGSGA